MGGVRDGRPDAVIRAAADDAKAKLTVIGADAYHDAAVAGVLTGSTAARLVRASTRPTLVVKQTAPDPYRSVLALVDFSEDSQHGLETLLDWAAPDAEVHVLHCFSLPAFGGLGSMLGEPGYDVQALESNWQSQANEELETFLGYVDFGGRPVHRHVELGPLTEVVDGMVRRCGIQVVGMGTRGRGRVRELLLGSTAETMLHAAACDVLVAPPSTRSRLAD